MELERLTWVEEDGSVHIRVEAGRSYAEVLGEALHRLALYEDAEARGLLVWVEFPEEGAYNVGDGAV